MRLDLLHNNTNNSVILKPLPVVKHPHSWFVIPSHKVRQYQEVWPASLNQRIDKIDR